MKALAVIALVLSAGGDQVFVRDAVTGALSQVSGNVTADELTGVVVETGGKPSKYPAELVERIEWGEVSRTYREGRTYFARGYWSVAAAALRMAAEDPSGRDVVRAHARLLAAEALLRWGAEEPAHFGEAAAEAARFQAEHPGHRDVPEARRLEARATWLAGEPAAAAVKYRALFDKRGADGTGGTGGTGYGALTCLRAGLDGARAWLAAGDAAAARELFAALATALDAQPAGAARHALAALRHEAELGPGFVDLALGNHGAARAFFQSQLDAARSGAQRYGALLGLGEALLAEKEGRAAQLNLARVAALEPSDRDRSARALVLLAESAVLLADADWRVQAERWLDTVLARYGDTPAAPAARQLMERVR